MITFLRKLSRIQRPIRRKERERTRWQRHRWALGPLLALVVFGAPTLWLHLITSDAADCFASIAARREAALPDCARRQGLIEPLEGLPFIGRPALRASEEIRARMAVWRYLDAAVGEPDRAAQAERIGPLWDAEAIFPRGSGRLRMDELGPPMPVPEPGQLAFATGDRASLDVHGERWEQHYTELRTFEALLLEGRVERAVALARHYAGRSQADLRLRVAALLCIGGDHRRGVDQLVDQEGARANERTGNFSRSYGDLRVVIERCAALGGFPAPAPPGIGHGGAWDQRARLAVVRLDVLRRRLSDCDLADPKGCRLDPLVASDVDAMLGLLSSPEAHAHRLTLLAAAAPALDAATATAAAQLEPLELTWLPEAWLAHPGDAPFVPPPGLEAGVRRLRELGVAAPVLRALEVRAAMAHAQAGELARADACLARAGLEGSAAALAAASAALLSGDRDAARTRAAAGDATPALELLRAELALPDRAAAEAHARAALAAGDDPTVERARWLLLSLGVLTRGREVVAAPATLAPRFAFVGPVSELVAPEVREATLDDALAQLHAWLGSDNPRASRYALFAQRGDAPAAFAAWLHAGAQLSSKPEQTEVWLDALMAFDQRRFTLRQVAFARWQAAAWRDDGEAAAFWRTRYLDLAKRAQDPRLGDLYLTLGV
jgi:hypothetical protein